MLRLISCIRISYISHHLHNKQTNKQTTTTTSYNNNTAIVSSLHAVHIELVDTQPIATSFRVDNQFCDFVDRLNLFVQEVAFKEVTEMGIVVGTGHTVHSEKGFVHFPLQCQSFFQCMNVRVPIDCRCFDVLEHNATSSFVLVFHQHLCVFSLLVRRLLEEGEHSFECHVISIEMVSHGLIDVACIQLHVPMFVDCSLAGFAVILTNGGHCCWCYVMLCTFEC